MPAGWAAGAAAVGTIVAGSMAADAAGNAADSQARSAQASIDEQRRQYDQTRADQAPFMQTGVAGNAKLANLLGVGGDSTSGDYGSLLKKFSSSDLANDPVYNSGLQFGLDQGTGAINQRALQSGGYDSGATLKALTQYANDYGSTKANDAYNRYNTDQSNVYNRLAGISGAGQTATNQVQSAGTNMANQVSNSLTDQGNARSAGIIGGANAWGSTASGLNGIYQNYNSNQMLQQLMNGSGSNTTGYGGQGTYGDGSGFTQTGSLS
jgi:hypothetical protein